MELFVIKYEVEDYPEIYGVFTSYVEAKTQKDMLEKYNTCAQYGRFKIYKYHSDKIYVNEKPIEC